MMELVENPCVVIPGWVTDLAAFRQWSRSDAFPEQIRVTYFKDGIWLDFSMETFAHNKVKIAIISELRAFVKAKKSGHVLSDRMRLVHPEVGVSTEPDGMYCTTESFQRLRVQLEKGNESLEVVGTPNMVLEVVSDTSEKKDTKELLKVYWSAGIPEYWIVDVRRDLCLFDIHRHGPKGYSTARKQAGWVKSEVFGAKLRLSREENGLGLVDFNLEMKEGR
jgi:Uma2 family endonuclease